MPQRVRDVLLEVAPPTRTRAPSASALRRAFCVPPMLRSPREPLSGSCRQGNPQAEAETSPPRGKALAPVRGSAGAKAAQASASGGLKFQATATSSPACPEFSSGQAAHLWSVHGTQRETHFHAGPDLSEVASSPRVEFWRDSCCDAQTRTPPAQRGAEGVR